MKEITRYICDFCNTEYVTEAEALHCEASHNEPAALDDKEWMFGKKYPDKLNVEMSDGAVCQYHYYREMRGATNE